MSLHTCRFCKKQEYRRMLKYGTRHYAHHGCWLNNTLPIGDQPYLQHLDALSLAEISNFPVLAMVTWLAQYGPNRAKGARFNHYEEGYRTLKGVLARKQQLQAVAL